MLIDSFLEIASEIEYAIFSVCESPPPKIPPITDPIPVPTIPPSTPEDAIPIIAPILAKTFDVLLTSVFDVLLLSVTVVEFPIE